MDYFNYALDEFKPCEVCGNPMVHVCHIDCRGMGGNPSGDKDVIENLIGMCYSCDTKYGDKKQYYEFLKETHERFMNQ